MPPKGNDRRTGLTYNGFRFDKREPLLYYCHVITVQLAIATQMGKWYYRIVNIKFITFL